jgi:uncharacterized membrane protein
MNKSFIISDKIIKLLFYGALSFFTYLMILITIQYIPINFDTAFLRIKQEQIQLLHYKLAFFTHVYTSIFVLMTGMIQFSNTIRKKYRKIHRTFGKIYMTIILLFAAPSGLIMGYYANGGLIAKISFCLLAILWAFFTLKAFIEIRRGNYFKHREYMIRSYSLTLSAISLRLFKYLIINAFHTPPMSTYIVVAWLGWVFNLMIAEFIIYRTKTPGF